MILNNIWGTKNIYETNPISGISLSETYVIKYYLLGTFKYLFSYFYSNAIDLSILANIFLL